MAKKVLKQVINVEVNEDPNQPALEASLFTPSGTLLGRAPVEKGRAVIEVPVELEGRRVQVAVAPRPEQGRDGLSLAGLRRLGVPLQSGRVLAETPVSIRIPGLVPFTCWCHLRGRLVKRVTLPNGEIGEQVVCNARVTICEVDRVRLLIEKLPEFEIFRLRDDLLAELRRPFPVPPRPPVAAAVLGDAHGDAMPEARSQVLTAAPRLDAGDAVLRLSAARPLALARRDLVELAPLVQIHICAIRWLWHRFTMDCLRTVHVDEQGRFDAWLAYPCFGDKPDLYFSVEQNQEGSWVSVYRPSVACNTHWDIDCDDEVVLNIPAAIGCDDPDYEVPEGVGRFVLPYSIGGTWIWGKPAGSPTPAAPHGWVRTDGLTNYDWAGLGALYDAPFGASLTFYQDDSYFIPSSGIKYYRYSVRRAGSADDWSPISTPLGRGYRMEYSGGGLPTYESYPVGPFTVGAQTSLFEFKPLSPPPRATDPATVIAREWTSGNLSEAAAVWDTTQQAPAIDDDHPADSSGVFEVRLEVFSPTGVRVAPGPSTFRFLTLNEDRVTTRVAEAGSAADPMEVFDDAFYFRVHVDNNGVEADLPQPSLDGVGADPDCGFLLYHLDAAPAQEVCVQFQADHPNDRAVFHFEIKRGSNRLDSASTPPSGSTPNYVEVATSAAPNGYSRLGVNGPYQRCFAPSALVGTCPNGAAAFAASLGVYGKATNGWHRLGYDGTRLIAFALSPE